MCLFTEIKARFIYGYLTSGVCGGKTIIIAAPMRGSLLLPGCQQEALLALSWGTGKCAQQGGRGVGNSRYRAVTGGWGQGLVSLKIPFGRLVQNILSPITEQLHQQSLLIFFSLASFLPSPHPLFFTTFLFFLAKNLIF